MWPLYAPWSLGTEVLPDSRARETRGLIRTPTGNMVPVYCANCGKPAGLVPESHITHVFALCDHGCAGKYGDAAHGMVDPDAIYRERATEAALKKYGRPLTQAEIERELDDRDSALGKIAREWHARVLRTER
jgi:hypothetical protein